MRDGLGSVQSVALFGGTSEIGLAIVRALVAERARTVVLAGRSSAALEREAAGLREAGATTVDVVEFDAERPEDHEEVVADVCRRHGDVDVAILAFGVLGDQESARHDREAALRIVRVNLLASVSVMVPLARTLREQGHGALVVLSSVAAERPRRSNFVYGSSKSGLDAFAQGLGDELAGSGVRVMVVRPGFVRTRMTEGLPDAPLATTPEHVAQAAVAGLRRGAHTVWAPPALRWVMLALRMLPRPLFRRLPL